MEADDMFRYDDDERHQDTVGQTTAGEGEDELDGLRAQLENKDKDLMLAAELGKALLEKNSDLEKKLEQSSEEYSQRIEVRWSPVSSFINIVTITYYIIVLNNSFLQHSKNTQ